MGKNLIIKGADFSENAVSIPEIVELTKLSNAFATSSSAVIGKSFDSISWTTYNTWLRWEAQIDVSNYNYTSEKFTQSTGTAGVLSVWILDENRIIIGKKSPENVDGILTVQELTITSENYPAAKYIGFCTNKDSTIFPKLLREGK